MATKSSPQPTVFDENALHCDRPELSTGRHTVRTWLLLGSVALLVSLLTGLVLLRQNWPFTRAQVEKDLADATFSTVVIESFQQTYFPRPGYIAKGVTFRRNQDRGNPPLIAVRRLTIQGSFLGLLTKHVPVIRAEGAHVIIPFDTIEPRLLNISG
jgi:hypothetical protein